MNWKERFKPSNPTEAGCLILLVAVLFSIVAYALGVLRYLPYIAMGAWLIFYAFRFAFQAHAAYAVSRRTAVVVCGVLVLAYFLIWVGILIAFVFGLSYFVSPANSWYLFAFSIVLAYAFYLHLIRFKQTVFERWLGWQPREGIGDE